MGAHDGAVDHRVFVVGVRGEMLKYSLPHTAFGPTTEPQMDLCPVTEPLRQIAPGNAGAIAIENSFNEQSIVRGRAADMAFAARKKVLDPIPLVV